MYNFVVGELLAVVGDIIDITLVYYILQILISQVLGFRAFQKCRFYFTTSLSVIIFQISPSTPFLRGAPTATYTLEGNPCVHDETCLFVFAKNNR